MLERRSKPQGPEKDGKENAPSGVSAHWNASAMKQSYANICNVTSTREEVSLLFGMNRPWQEKEGKVTVDLTDRIILNPYTAKRFSAVLKRVIREYEARFGQIQLEAGSSGRPGNGG